jgi:threonine/homoserine/homoserine lactone efflux protein
MYSRLAAADHRLDSAADDPSQSGRGHPRNQPRHPAAALGEGPLGLTTRANRRPTRPIERPRTTGGVFLCSSDRRPTILAVTRQETTVDPSLLPRGLVLGFTIAAAVGPISLLTIRRTLAHGRIYGLASGLGVACADATYAAVAAFGLTAITSILVDGRTILGLVGGAFLIVLAIRTMTSRPSDVAVVTERPGLVAAFGSIFGLTMTNPMTILSFAGLFAGLGLSSADGADAVLLVLGVFLGSAAWWVLLTSVVAVLRTRVTIPVLTWINRLSGSAILVFGVVAIIAALGR